MHSIYLRVKSGDRGLSEIQLCHFLNFFSIIRSEEPEKETILQYLYEIFKVYEKQRGSCILQYKVRLLGQGTPDLGPSGLNVIYFAAPPLTPQTISKEM